MAQSLDVPLPFGAWFTIRSRTSSYCCLAFYFPRFLATATRFTSHFDGSLAPKVVQIIESYNNLHAFFVIFVFSGDFLRFSAQISGRSLRRPRVSICEQQRASAGRGCGPRDSASRSNTHASAHRSAVLSSAARTFGATPAAAEDKF